VRFYQLIHAQIWPDDFPKWSSGHFIFFRKCLHLSKASALALPIALREIQVRMMTNEGFLTLEVLVFVTIIGFAILQVNLEMVYPKTNFK
jgi:hypothetical protein